MRAETLCTAAGLPLAGPLLLTPRVFEDPRGFFFESWNQQTFAAALAEHSQQAPDFVQDNHSRSSQGVLRGLHWQVPPHPQGKLVRCVVGEIWDVAVDLRRRSPSFGHWVGARLSADNHQQLWIPAGFAHGFVSLSASVEVLYKATDFWNREAERSLRWDDPQLAITWPMSRPLLSDKDGEAPLLGALTDADLFA